MRFSLFSMERGCTSQCAQQAVNWTSPESGELIRTENDSKVNKTSENKPVSSLSNQRTQCNPRKPQVHHKSVGMTDHRAPSKRSSDRTRLSFSEPTPFSNFYHHHHRRTNIATSTYFNVLYTDRSVLLLHELHTLSLIGNIGQFTADNQSDSKRSHFRTESV